MLLPLWFTKLTLDPTGTVTLFGVTPLFRMVMVAASPGRGFVFPPPPPEGPPGEPLPPPQALRAARATTSRG